MLQKWISRLYDVVLLRMELAFIAFLLANVVGLSLLLILARSFHFSVWDPSSLSRIIFASAFLACLYSGCLAARTNRHIAIDALASLLPGSIRRHVEGFVAFVAAVASLAICYHALRYVDSVVDPRSSLAPASDAWFLREWVWKLSLAAAFASMSVHFSVRAIRCFASRGDPSECQAAPKA
jgi:TRAP-type C4-dicarboxylate transport system permease small subunit